MFCGITCSIGLMFLIANLYVTFTADKTKQKNDFYNTLSRDKIEKYESIINERRGIYFKGYGLGFMLAFITLFFYEKFQPNELNRICFIGGITLSVNYFYYMLSPKTDYMILHLDNKQEREAWLKIYKSMQINYHAGFLLGLIAMMFMGNAIY